MQKNKRINRSFWSMMAFITCGLIVICLLGLNVYAADNDPVEGTVQPVTKFNIDKIITSSDYSDLNYKSNFTLTSDEVAYYDSIRQNNPSINNVQTLGTYISNYNYYIWTNDGFFPCDSMSFLAVSKDSTNNNIYIHIPQSVYSYLLTDETNYVSRAYINSGLVLANSDIQHVSIGNLTMIDNEPYLRLGYYAQKLINSNAQIYAFNGDTGNITTLTGGEQINPSFTPENVENSSNNMYLEDAQWVWTTFNPINDNVIAYNFNVENLNRSYANLNFTPTSYQINNPGNFSFKVTGSIKFSMSYKLDGGKYSNWTGSYTYNIPFTQTNMYSLQFKFQDLFNSSGFTGYFNDHYQGAINMDSSLFTITYTAEVVDNSGHSSSNIEDTYNVLQNKVKTNSTAITNNNNPYVPSGDDTSLANTDLPTTQTGNGVISNPSGNVPTGTVGTTSNGGMYVDNRFTLNNNSTATVDYAKDNLLPTTAGEGGFTEQLSGVTESNRFINYMSSTFSFIPQSFFENLSTYFYIFLGILVAYFVLRLLLDIL